MALRWPLPAFYLFLIYCAQFMIKGKVVHSIRVLCTAFFQYTILIFSSFVYSVTFAFFMRAVSFALTFRAFCGTFLLHFLTPVLPDRNSVFPVRPLRILNGIQLFCVPVSFCLNFWQQCTVFCNFDVLKKMNTTNVCRQIDPII